MFVILYLSFWPPSQLRRIPFLTFHHRESQLHQKRQLRLRHGRPRTHRPFHSILRRLRSTPSHSSLNHHFLSSGPSLLSPLQPTQCSLPVHALPVCNTNLTIRWSKAHALAPRLHRTRALQRAPESIGSMGTVQSCDADILITRLDGVGRYSTRHATPRAVSAGGGASKGIA